MKKRCGSAVHKGIRLISVGRFYKHKSRPDGLSIVCKACANAQAKQARLKNLEAHRDRGMQYYASNKPQILDRMKQKYQSRKNDPAYIAYQMLCNAKSRAIKNNWEFTISLEDVIIPDICPVLGIPINRGDIKASDNSPTLDRIDSTKGYIKGNVSVISKRANTIKNNGTPEEHRLIYEYYNKYNARPQT